MKVLVKAFKKVWETRLNAALYQMNEDATEWVIEWSDGGCENFDCNSQEEMFCYLNGDDPDNVSTPAAI